MTLLAALAGGVIAAGTAVTGEAAHPGAGRP
jgi:hypothetical protein